MKIKIIIILGLLVSSITYSFAQERKKEKTVLMDTIVVDYKTRYVSHSFLDNFYVEGAFAGRMLIGSEDNMLPFGKRIKPGFSVAVG